MNEAKATNSSATPPIASHCHAMAALTKNARLGSANWSRKISAGVRVSSKIRERPTELARPTNVLWSAQISDKARAM